MQFGLRLHQELLNSEVHVKVHFVIKMYLLLQLSSMIFNDLESTLKNGIR